MTCPTAGPALWRPRGGKTRRTCNRRLPPRNAGVRIDLQEFLHQVYDATGSEDFIAAGRPHPALSAKDAAWARCIVPTP